MKKTLVKTHSISFQEKNSDKIRSFDCPKEHLKFHLRQMKSFCINVSVSNKKG